MGKSVKTILGDAYKFVGLAPNGVLNARYVTEGLQFANEILQKYNEGCLFPFTFVTVTGSVSGGSATIAPSSNATFNSSTPANVSAVYRKNGDNYVKLNKCAYSDIFSARNSGSIPYWYSFSLKSDTEGEFHFDATGSFNVVIVYPKKLDALTINGTLDAPPIYEQVIRYGVAVRAAQQEGFEPSAYAAAQKNLDDAVRVITADNGAKMPVKRILTSLAYDRHSAFICPRFR